jgi:hypothetical protein
MTMLELSIDGLGFAAGYQGSGGKNQVRSQISVN